MKQILLSCAAGLVIALANANAHAAPILQLYIQGSTYDSATESWVLEISPGETFVLWTIGNVDGNGGKGTISDVKLSAVYDSIFDDLVISLTGTTTGGFEGFTDPSTPDDETSVQTVDDGSTPTLSDGSSLPPHDEYGEGRTWQEFELGDFTLTDSPGGDFIDSLPDPTEESDGYQINAYEVSFSSPSDADLSQLIVHFDLYDAVEAGNHALSTFAPFSHDATATPEPASLLLAGMGALGFVGYGLRRRKKYAVEKA